jgi:hypothetical protein
VSDATLSNPQVRATQNKWYLYFSRAPYHGPDGHVRAVIEEVCDEILNGDGGPKRTLRRVYLDAEEVRDTLPPEAWIGCAAHDGLDQTIESEMSDERFQELINDGTVIPISVPR